MTSPFAAAHAALRGFTIDFSAFDASVHDPELLVRARGVWAERVHSEYRSLQIMTRFMTEVTDTGEPIELLGTLVDLITDEARHVGLCWDLCLALGGRPDLPSPPQLIDPPEFLAAPTAQRALATAITMLLVNETLSVAWLRDLAERCRDPVVGAVLRATVEDEEDHDAFGWAYARLALDRFHPSTRPTWQALAQRALHRHQTWAAGVADAPDDPREQALVNLGLFSPQRQARVYQQVWRGTLGPRLLGLGLL